MMSYFRLMNRGAFAAALIIATGCSAFAAGPFGGFRHDSTQPIEIASDSLEVQEAIQLAIFTGNVVAGQGTMRLTADKLNVTYGDGGAGSGQIRNIEAEGNVFIANEAETATGDRAEYNVASGMIHMTGDVTLTQGGNVVKGQELTIDLNSGQGRVEGGGGRVRSVFTPAPKD